MFRWAKLAFSEAIKFFTGKLLNFPTQRYDQIREQEHDWAFSVAGATKATLLQDLRGAVGKAIAEGTTLQQFKDEFNEIVTRQGWNPKGGKDWRARIIYDTNLRTAYGAGRYEQQTDPETSDTTPYWQYNHGDSRVPRPHHLALDGKVFRKDDPFWAHSYPPSGYNCKCFVTTLTPGDLRRLGKDRPDVAPQIGEAGEIEINGERKPFNYGPDKGWGFIPGKSRLENRQEILQQLLDRLPPELRAQVEADIARDQGQ